MEAGIYEHYKGGFYQVLGVAADATNERSLQYGREGFLAEDPAEAEEDRLMVVYITLTGIHLPGPRMRVRELNEFCGVVTWPDGIQRMRFIYRGESLAALPAATPPNPVRQ